MFLKNTRLGSLASFRNGLNYTQANAGNGLKVINVADFKDRITPDYSSLGEINPQRVADEDDLLADGDIIFVRSNGNRDLIGRSMLIRNPPEPVSFSAFAIRLRFHSPEACPLFFVYLFRSPLFRSLLSQRGAGTNICNLNQRILSEFEVSVPSRPDQERIANILSTYDDLIENNCRRMALLEESARHLYQEWFVGLRFPGHEKMRITDDMPAGWERRPLSSICSLITDGAHRSPPSVDAGLPMASMKDMEDWQLNLASCRTITQEDFDLLVRSGCKPEVGDVLVAKDGANYLKYVLVFTEPIDVVLLSSIAILRPNEAILPYLLRFSLNNPSTKARLANRVSGVAIPRIIVRDFASFEIVVPPRPLQDQWWLSAESTIRLIHVLLKQNQKLRAARDLLLPRVMSGEVVI
jgi:type I restriction enzyme S subunit